MIATAPSRFADLFARLNAQFGTNSVTVAMISSDAAMTGELNENLNEGKTQQENRKRKVPDSTSASPDAVEQKEKKPKVAKVEEVKKEEREEEDDEEMDEKEDEEKTYDVEKIIGHKLEKGNVLYHVKWEGFDDSENTFEPVSNLRSVSHIVDAYKKSLSEEDRQELEGKKKSKRSISPVKKAATPSAKTRNTPKTAKKVKEEEPEEEADADVADEGVSEDNAEDEDKEEEEEKTYDVEKIIGHKLDKKGEVLYHVKWEGFDDSENTFEPMSNLHSVSHIVEAYKKSLSEEAREELEDKKKRKRSISTAKTAVTPSNKARNTPKTNKKTIANDEEEEVATPTAKVRNTPKPTKKATPLSCSIS